MFKIKRNYNVESYKIFLEQILVDREIKEEILNLIEIFNEGKITFDGSNLYGKIIDKKGNDYIEIKYQNGFLVCNYTDWAGGKIVNINQVGLKRGNVKVNRREKIEYVCYNYTNQTNVEEIEKIYDKNKNKIYDSKLTYNEEYDATENFINYSNKSCFDNRFELYRQWYIPTGEIISYRLSKSYMDNNSQIEENYSICPGVIVTEYERRYNFEKLDENLFKNFMSGQISIEELLEQNNTINEGRQKVK